MISQFTPDTPNIPPTQPDRSRTPTRQPPGLNHHLPTFRGPLHFATTQFRPGLPRHNLPPPPPPRWMLDANQRWTNAPMAPMTQQFPPAPPTTHQPTYDPTTQNPPRPTWTPRSGHCVNQKEATQNMAKEIAQLLQSWLPSQPPADQASQQRILELEAEVARMKSEAANPQANASTPTPPSSSPIGRALQGQAAASAAFDPAVLLVSPGTVNPWLVANQPDSLTETQYKRWLKDLKLPQHQQETLTKNLEKVKEWWNKQPDDAAKTVQRASVAMGIDAGKHRNATSDEIVLRVMTVALLMHS